jgi:hypothetical protein
MDIKEIVRIRFYIVEGRNLQNFKSFLRGNVKLNIQLVFKVQLWNDFCSIRWKFRTYFFKLQYAQELIPQTQTVN